MDQLAQLLLRLFVAATIGGGIGFVLEVYWYTSTGRFRWTQLKRDKARPKQTRWQEIAKRIRRIYIILGLLTAIAAQGFRELFPEFQYMTAMMVVIGVATGLSCYIGEKRPLYRSKGWVFTTLVASLVSTWLVELL